MGALSIMEGDTFKTQAEADTFAALLERGKVLASDSWNGGWGHHSVEAVVEMDGKFYHVSGSGCSCDGGGSVSGPFDTQIEAGGDGLEPGDNVSEH